MENLNFTISFVNFPGISDEFLLGQTNIKVKKVQGDIVDFCVPQEVAAEKLVIFFFLLCVYSRIGAVHRT